MLSSANNKYPKFVKLISFQIEFAAEPFFCLGDLYFAAAFCVLHNIVQFFLNSLFKVLCYSLKLNQKHVKVEKWKCNKTTFFPWFLYKLLLSRICPDAIFRAHKTLVHSWTVEQCTQRTVAQFLHSGGQIFWDSSSVKHQCVNIE